MRHKVLAQVLRNAALGSAIFFSFFVDDVILIFTEVKCRVLGLYSEKICRGRCNGSCSQGTDNLQIIQQNTP